MELRALQRKSAFEVVAHLNEIFGTFGAPRILQSDNGREFVNNVVRNLMNFWPDCKVVHGRPRPCTVARERRKIQPGHTGFNKNFNFHSKTR